VPASYNLHLSLANQGTTAVQQTCSYVQSVRQQRSPVRPSANTEISE